MVASPGPFLVMEQDRLLSEKVIRSTTPYNDPVTGRINFFTTETVEKVIERQVNLTHVTDCHQIPSLVVGCSNTHFTNQIKNSNFFSLAYHTFSKLYTKSLNFVYSIGNGMKYLDIFFTLSNVYSLNILWKCSSIYLKIISDLLAYLFKNEFSFVSYLLKGLCAGVFLQWNILSE